jgi:hypothetical protein
MVFLRQARSEHAQPGEVDRARSKGVGDRRQPPGCARDLDAVVSRIVGESKVAYAEGVHRGERPVEVELAMLDFADVNDEVGLDDGGLARSNTHSAETASSPSSP